MFRINLTFCALISLLPAALFAQEKSTVLASDIALYSAFSNLNPSNLAVYTGREYYTYFIKPESKYAVTTVTLAASRTGEHPFFINDDFKPEAIEFDNILYQNILINYDICRSEVVVLNPQRKAIILPEGKVQKFSYAGHSFQALTGVKNLKNDFYDILHGSDSVILCAKRRKIQNELWRTISDYYIILNHAAYPISLVSTKSVGVKSAVLRILADREDELRTYIRENKIRFSKSKKEQSLIKVVDYYASLKTK